MGALLSTRYLEIKGFVVCLKRPEGIRAREETNTKRV